LTIDLQKKTKVTLKDLIQPEHLQDVMRLERQKLLEHREMLFEPEAFEKEIIEPPMPVQGQLVVYGNFSSFYLTDKALVTSYDPYEIGPYAAGHQETELLFEEIAPWIKKDGPLAPYVR
jgi:hypothetical protein